MEKDSWEYPLGFGGVCGKTDQWEESGYCGFEAQEEEV